MKTIVYILALSFLQGCTIGETAIHKSTQCEQYYSLIKHDWKDYGDYYQFKQKPDYLRKPELQKIFFQDLCLENLSGKELKRLLGCHHEEFDLGNRIRKTYCLAADCDQKWDFYLDSLDYVREIYLNPLFIDSD